MVSQTEKVENTRNTIEHTICLSVNARLTHLPPSKAEKDRMAGRSDEGWLAREMTLAQLGAHLEDGAAIAPVYRDGKRSKETWLASGFVALDFDYGPDWRELLKHPLVQQHACVVGATASHTEDDPHSRIVFLLAEPITDRDVFKKYARRLIYQFVPLTDIDESCAQADRFYFGLQAAHVQPGRPLTIADLEALPKPVSEWPPIEEAPSPPLTVQHNSDGANRHSTYVEQAIADECATVASAPESTRNTTLNKAAYNLGQLVGATWANLSESRVEGALLAAARQCGLSEEEALRTIHSGLTAGIRQPRPEPETIVTTSLTREMTRPPAQNGQRKATNGSTAQKEAEPDEKTVAMPAATRPPTQDEMGDTLIAMWDGNRAYFREDWHTYNQGVWMREHNPRKAFWDVMVANKPKGLNPKPMIARGIEEYTLTRAIVPDESIDNGGDYANLRNGLYNLKTGKLEAHRRDLYLTSQLAFDYDPAAKCPHWQQFLTEMLVTPDGAPDSELVALLQEAFGYSLTSDTDYRVSFWLHGETASGKSTVINTVKALMGSAQTEINLSALDTNMYQLADIAGKRVISCTEAKAGSALEDNIFKALVAGEEMVVREIRKAPFRVKPTAKIWWAMNDKPRVNDRSDAVYSRTVLIPFNHSIPREQWNLRLGQLLESEVAGIFNWALEGLKRLRAQGDFTRPAQVIEAVREFKAENDTEAAFVGDWCERKDEIGSSELYNAYRIWCRRNGHNPKSSTKVAKDWQRLGFTKTRTAHGIVYHGVSLTLDATKSIAFTPEKSEIPF